MSFTSKAVREKPYRVALFASCTDIIAAASFTTLSTGNLPVILRALVATGSLDIGQARALTGVTIAVLECSICSENIALAS